MKKRHIFAAAIIAAVLLAGCGTIKQTAQTPEPAEIAVTDMPYGIERSAVHPEDIVTPGQYIPTSIRRIHERLTELSTEEWSGFRIDPEIRYNEYSPTFRHYTIIATTEHGSSADGISLVFDAAEKTCAGNPFHATFNAEYNGFLMKDLITALYMTFDDSLAEEEAREMTYRLTDSYSTDNMSDFVYCGRYASVIQPGGFKDAFRNSTLYFVPVEETVNMIQADAAFYSELVYDRALKEMNRCERVSFTAEVSEIRFEDMSIINNRKMYAVCILPDGNPIYVELTPDRMTEALEYGKSYTFYGEIGGPYDGVPWIEIEGVVANSE